MRRHTATRGPRPGMESVTHTMPGRTKKEWVNHPPQRFRAHPRPHYYFTPSPRSRRGSQGLSTRTATPREGIECAHTRTHTFTRPSNHTRTHTHSRCACEERPLRAGDGMGFDHTTSHSLALRASRYGVARAAGRRTHRHGEREVLEGENGRAYNHTARCAAMARAFGRGALRRRVPGLHGTQPARAIAVQQPPYPPPLGESKQP